ncbi:DEAD/DEAH box helicase [Mesorhizobium sp.]|uniref:DEAD/DEAH box helicase n=1 Tax=Mesorhizobium sp. TaxID=1871066 RepID=UPI000FE3138C|nr:DEAD/DEAH box helicase [Mesorhizobium sp.]RWN59373.1 MAG: DEAD/DEAH box helicase [Mesorhizobium sp.]RWN80879.1 MAG: DEAD/DEAH box helicase [Mesorhizobium sp.]RWN83334.1 MAG: DEAD/DEAH box helicase [Mesorhizobium sp.]RWN86772.1 MAG: DEAD/DEAH box helicase [Mesorhizobium sp.]RWO16407.1 MAG: DEAD/DEAH box helicase [Mesorhizobium sp.]
MPDVHPRLRRQADLNLGVLHQGFAYQLEAVEAVKHLTFAALFHEQGLGKTKIGVDLALEWLREDTVDAILFITKRGLIQNWVDELRAHSHLKPRILDQNHASNFFAFNSPTPIYLTHYEVMRSEERRMALFLKTRRVGVILDEAHKIKNPDAEITKALHRLALKFVRRIIMTGTPVANRPYDLWSQIFFLDQGGSLGTDFASFKDQLDLTNDLWGNDRRRKRFEETLAGIFSRIRDFSVRETKASAGIELPDKHIQNVPVELAPRQRELYEQVKHELSALVVVNNKLVEDNSEEILKRLLRLVQLASNPRLVDEAYDELPGKTVALDALVQGAVGAGSKLIVWTSFVANVDQLTTRLKPFGAVKVHGALDMSERNEAIAAFKQDPECRVLVATPGAAKEGLTLTVANHAVFYDRSFSLDDYLQAQDRIHRISQSQTCYVWNLIGVGTVDEWVDLLLTAKRLAAQLAQADVDRDEYSRLANYDFGRIVKEILGSHD